jgi:ribosomal protein S18 acetylase RimI-like enzyme
VSASLRAMTQAEFDAWYPHVQEGYVADIVRAGVDEDAARAKAARDFPHYLPDGLATEGQWLYTVESDGEAVGALWVTEREDDFGRTLFILDVEIDEAMRGRGLGKAAMLLAEEEARRRGIERVTLNVFGGNDVARSLYRSLDYAEAAVYMQKSL